MRSMAAVVGFFLLAGVVMSASASGRSEQPVSGLVSNIVQHPMTAADFTLTDQHNQPFHLADARGKVVVMTFIYTHCTDICPFISVKVKDAYKLLGSDALNVVFVAVTTDPKRDVPDVTSAYSKAVGLNDVWHFVGGAAKDVQAVWAHYAIGVTMDQDTGAVAPPTGAMKDMPVPSQGLSKADLDLAAQIGDQFGGGYDVGHSAPFWIVDKKGLIQVGMDSDANPSDIVTNVRALLRAS
jgi:cytochrome oxidase Cu insertion factor (SCO1/SenC/PrrC family)